MITIVNPALFDYSRMKLRNLGLQKNKEFYLINRMKS